MSWWRFIVYLFVNCLLHSQVHLLVEILAASIFADISKNRAEMIEQIIYIKEKPRSGRREKFTFILYLNVRMAITWSCRDWCQNAPFTLPICPIISRKRIFVNVIQFIGFRCRFIFCRLKTIYILKAAQVFGKKIFTHFPWIE